MLQLLWNIFKETGEINSYMLYKAIEDSDQNEGFSDIFDGDGSANQASFEDKI